MRLKAISNESLICLISKKLAILFSLALVFFLHSGNIHAQETEEVKDSIPKHSPKKAALLSTFLPSAGQAYNKKYWKMPIVYAGLGASLYFIIDNHKNYRNFRQEYIDRLNTGQTFVNPDFEAYRDQDLITIQDTYRRWRDLSYISFGLIYVLQIVDASVDAHFYDWETKISEDLSLRIGPHSSLATRSFGLKFSLRFK